MSLEPETISAPVTHTHYTCPMHHQIIRDEPGNRPICGVTLEPITVTLSEANPELDKMTRRLWIGAILTLPLLAIMVSDFVPGHPIQGLLKGPSLGWFELAIASPVVLWAGLLLSPMIAAAAMSFSSVAVVGNSLRLRSVKLS